MAGLLTRYHRVVMPKGKVGTGSTRVDRAHQIKSLRKEVGHKRARGLVLNSVKTHIRGAKEAERQQKVSTFKAKHPPTVKQSPRWRKRGGGKVTVKSLPKLPKSLVKPAASR